MNEKETRTPGYRIDETPDNNADTEFARADADVAKLATDLEDLRQTLLRRQADFENYKSGSRRSARRTANGQPRA